MGKPGMLQAKGSQRVGHDLVTKQPPPQQHSFDAPTTWSLLKNPYFPGSSLTS